MEDVLEEIVGNIMDEYDEDKKYLGYSLNIFIFQNCP